MRVGLFVPCYVDAFEPEVGDRHPRAAGAARLHGGIPLRPDVLWSADGQYRLPRRSRRHRSAVREELFRLRLCRRAVGILRPPSPRASHRDPPDRRVAPRPCSTYELVEFLHDVLKVEDLPWTNFPQQGRLSHQLQRLAGIHHARPSELVKPYYSKPSTSAPRQGCRARRSRPAGRVLRLRRTFSVFEPAVFGQDGYDKVATRTAPAPNWSSRRIPPVSCIRRAAPSAWALPLKYIHIAQVLNGATA